MVKGYGLVICTNFADWVYFSLLQIKHKLNKSEKEFKLDSKR